jgi:hypothetical protein
MNSNRNVLRPTQNRLPLKDVTSQKYASIELINKQEQENFVPKSRPILTAIRSIKQHSKENENHTQMFISPMVKTNLIISNNNNKTREQLEQELYEL